MGNAENSPNRNNTILGAEITGGFMQGARLEFSQGLNCIIGGRGTGKTTILELVRHVLGLMPDPKRSARSRAHSVVQNNLGNGRVRLHFQTRHGMSYTAERPWNDECQILDEKGVATTISLERDRIFRADVYSQNEIEQIATDPEFQLKLIDQFEEEKIREINTGINQVLRDVSYSAGELSEYERRMADLAEIVSEGPAIEEKLKGFQKQDAGPDGHLIQQAHSHKVLRDLEKKAIASLTAEFSSLGGKYQSYVESLAQRLVGHVGSNVAAGPNEELFRVLVERIQNFITEFRTSVPWFQQECQNNLVALGMAANELEGQHALQEQAYRELLAKNQEEQGLLAERINLQKRQVEVNDANRQLEELKKQYAGKSSKHWQLTSRLTLLRDERFRLRNAIAERLSKALYPTIRVTVSQFGNRQALVDLLSGGLKGSGLKYASLVEKIVQHISAEELTICVKQKDVARLAESIGIDTGRAVTIIERLATSQTLIKLETVEMDDLPCIELLDGRDYKSAACLSTGQRCTTILPILLLESDRPLLIDQPEDNLDNAFIFETIVKSVRAAKMHRQLIFITHNPNIPVLGEAERVFVLTSDGRQGSVIQQGTVDDVKERIELLLEGGRDAFLQRKIKYGH